MDSHRSIARRPPRAAPAFLALGAAALAAACGPEREPGGPAPDVRSASATLSPPLWLVPPAPPGALPAPTPLGLDGPLAAGPARKATSLALEALAATSPPASFDGLGVGTPWPGGAPFVPAMVPPDPNGDVGPAHYVQTVNSHLAVFDKTGAILYGPAPLGALWAGFTATEGDALCAGTNQADPIVAYDPLADRWVITFMANRKRLPAYQCVAVSATPDPTGPYHRYALGPYSAGTTPAQNDYGKIGVWPDAYYASYEMEDVVSGARYGPKLCAWEREKMLAGAPAREVCFQLPTLYRGILPADLDGLAPPPAGAPGLFVGQARIAGIPPRHLLRVWRLRVSWAADPAAATLDVPVELPVDPFSYPCAHAPVPARPWTCVPQADGDLLDTLGQTLMHRVAYRVLRDGTEAIVANHTVEAGTAADPRTGIRWYELRNAPAQTMGSAAPIVHQQGTYAPDGDWRWMGSIAMDADGNIALGYSVSGELLNPTLRHAGRRASDPAGAMSLPEGSLLEGSATGAQAGSDRWGDYGALAVDPVDDCTFWFTGEYLKTTGLRNWSTRIGAFRLPGCPSASFRIDLGGPSAVAGRPLGFTLTALDASGAPDPAYDGTVALSAGGAAVTPATTVLSAGTSTEPLSVVFTRAGTGTLVARDASRPSMAGTASVAVLAAAADRYEMTGLPPSLPAGGSATLTLRATDPFGNLVTSYAGGATLSSTDPRARVTPGTPAFTAGVATASVVLETAGPQSVTASNGTTTGQASTTVASGAAARLVFTNVPASAAAGVPTSFAIEARDAFGNLAAGYAGAAELSATGGAVAPGTATFAAGRSVEALSVTFTAAGTQVLSVHDAGSPNINGTQTVSISAAPAASYVFSALPASVSAGMEVRFTLRAMDAYGNPDLAYTGTANLSCSDPQASHPATVVFTGGVAADVPITLRTAGPQTITAADATNPALKAQATVSSDQPPAPPPEEQGGGGCGYGASGGLEALGLAAALLLLGRRARRGGPVRGRRCRTHRRLRVARRRASPDSTTARVGTEEGMAPSRVFVTPTGKFNVYNTAHDIY